MRSSRRERAIGRETAIHISSIARENKIANLRREHALLQATTELRFHGEVIIESREDATRTATTIANSKPGDDPRQLVFFVDGSRFTNIKDKRNWKAPASRKATGAAVVYQTDAEVWEERVFNLADGHKSQSAEMAAIAEGLAIALSRVLCLGHDRGQGKSKVVIFSDCQAAIHRLGGFRRAIVDERRLRGNAIVRKPVTRSQYLRRLGVEVEIRWVRGHAGVEANVRADRAARSAAWRLPGLAEGVYLYEGLQTIELEIAGQEVGMTSSVA